MKIETDVEKERELAKALLELRSTFTRVSVMLPLLPLEDLLMLAGVVEQAKTEGMKKPIAEAKKAAKTAKAAKAEADEEARAIPDVPIQDNSLTVTIGKTKVHAMVAAAKLIVQKGPLTVNELIEGIQAKGWKLNSNSEHVYQIVRGLLVRQEKYFKAVNKDGTVKFDLRGRAKPATPKIRKRKEKTSDKVRADVLRTLASVRKPITTPELAEKVGLSSGQGLVPLLVSLKEHGAVKKVVQDEVTAWDPNREKLKEYDAARGHGVFTNGHVQALNGVSHA